MDAFIKIFIERPVMTTCLCLFLLFMGVASIFQMPLRLMPEINQARVDITTTLPGASPEVIQSFVTSKIQNQIVGIKGLDYVTSKSSNGVSMVTVYLAPDASIEQAVADITQKTNGILDNLPVGTKPPIVSKSSIEDTSLLMFSFTSSTRSIVDITDYLNRVLVPQFESMNGVQSANVFSSGRYAMRIALNPFLLRARGLTAEDVIAALQNQNVIASPGVTHGNTVNYGVTTNTNLSSADEFNHMTIKTINGYAIKLQDVGSASLGPEDNAVMVQVNGEDAALLGIQNIAESNPLNVAKRVLQNWEGMKAHVPADIQAHLVLNLSVFTSQSLHEVFKTIFETLLIVVLTLYAFLKNHRAVLIPVVTIPLSLIGVCFVMNIVGGSLNTITLLAMVLAIGLVVDDAIVVVENVVRYLEKGASPMDATLSAMQELLLPIIAMTLTLAAVFLPIGFSGGLTGEVFKEFAWTLAMSVVISGILAFTLTPMMCAKFLKNTGRAEVLWFERLKEKYMQMLNKVFTHPRAVFWVWVGVIVSVAILYEVTPSELLPKEDQGYLTVFGAPPGNANRSYVAKYARNASAVYQSFPGIKDTVGIIGDTFYQAYLIMNTETKNPVLPLVAPLQDALSKVTGLNLYVNVPETIPSGGSPIGFVLTAPVSYKDLSTYAKAIEKTAMATHQFQYVSDDLNFTSPQALIQVDPTHLDANHVSRKAVADALSDVMSNAVVQQFNWQGRSYDVVVKSENAYQQSPDDLQTIPVATDSGGIVPLSAVADLSYSVVPTALNQFNKVNSVTLNGAMAPGVSLSQGINILNQIAAKILPPEVMHDYAGGMRQYLAEGHRLLFIFACAFLIIYLVLCMQFESYRDGFTILAGSVPFALFGALTLLKLGVGELNIYSQIGLLTLIGLVSKHGILIVKFAGEIKARTHASNEIAVKEAAILRLRPILMTTAAIVFGALPLVFASGPGSQGRHAMGDVIFFGMLLGTVFTLFFVPVLYTFVAREVAYES
jgi:multidrug efflux pump